MVCLQVTMSFVKLDTFRRQFEYVCWLRENDTLNVKMNALQILIQFCHVAEASVCVCVKETNVRNDRDNVQFKHRTTDRIYTCGFSCVASCGSGVPNAMSGCHSCFATITQYTSGAKTKNMVCAAQTHTHTQAQNAIMAAQLGWCRQFHGQNITILVRKQIFTVACIIIENNEKWTN